MKAVKEGKFPNLRRIELNECTMNDCEWPEAPEFSCDLRDMTMSQMQKLLLKLTELSVSNESHDFDRLIPVRLENLSVLKVNFITITKLQSLNDVLKQGLVPNLSALTLDGVQIKLDTFLREFDPNDTAKLEKLTLRGCTVSAEGLEIPGAKLTDIRLTELDLYGSLTGGLSALFTHRFPRLNSLKLRWRKLNANDLQSLAQANVEGKLPQLRHLDISHASWCEQYKISDLFTHSAQWNQLTTLGTTDGSILNVDPKFLTSLEELCLSEPLWLKENQFPLVTRCWSGLKTIQLESDEGITCVADGVERGMFPDLTTVKLQCSYIVVNAISLFKLFKANIVII